MSLPRTIQKCYQLWQHRQFVVDRLNSADREKEFFLEIMEEDSKNFHAWTFRQWLINRFDLWEAELPFVDELLDEDVRNNSAWNQRFYILTNDPHAPLTEEAIQKEVEFSTSKISVVAFNECPWNYIKGLYIRFYGKDAYKPKLLTVANSLKEQGIKSRHLLAWFVDIYSSPGMGDVAHGIEACKNLISADFVRSKYWTYQLEKLQKLVQ
ncbi:CAAX geranylgeranyltransferase alpha subunit [Entomophthora muscae]|uniref:CAAX geranylgeranyltransferase alpha subunit n=2 Tax=Entomophthora muscae TaxID=34485 RepID=A0ACC2RY02_9FUNG|nr:CAAX geranylgeranyltransferase alpha subunit [Entomophthora muscae]